MGRSVKMSRRRTNLAGIDTHHHLGNGGGAGDAPARTLSNLLVVMDALSFIAHRRSAVLTTIGALIGNSLISRRRSGYLLTTPDGGYWNTTRRSPTSSQDASRPLLLPSALENP